MIAARLTPEQTEILEKRLKDTKQSAADYMRSLINRDLNASIETHIIPLETPTFEQPSGTQSQTNEVRDMFANMEFCRNEKRMVLKPLLLQSCQKCRDSKTCPKSQLKKSSEQDHSQDKLKEQLSLKSIALIKTAEAIEQNKTMQAKRRQEDELDYLREKAEINRKEKRENCYSHSPKVDWETQCILIRLHLEIGNGD